MSETARRQANAAQSAASDPGVSAFVGASAGSGKTKLLTDRLLRLMLAGTDPGRIQCLTFTRAAAAEMAVRLQRTLGNWVSLPDPSLDRELERLAVPTGAAARLRARKLFAVVLDLPGGMRIGTIHAFCQSLLRRFPLEASLSPHFRLIEDQDAGGALADSREAMLAGAEAAGLAPALRLLAAEVSADAFAALVDRLRARDGDVLAAVRDGPDALGAAMRRALGVAAPDAAALMRQAVDWPGAARLRDALLILAQDGSPSIVARALKQLDWLALDAGARGASWPAWRDCFLTNAGERRKPGALVAGRRATQQPALLEAMLEEAERVWFVEAQLRSLHIAELSAALALLAAPVLHGYRAHKELGGLLDYEDLVTRSRQLLHDPGVAWVLYKLDGCIDHLLLDEVQDTAPRQWEIAKALTDEFFAGAGARQADGTPARSVFAVGDRKQSIFSFQGADTAVFDAARGWLEARVLAGGGRWVDGRLEVSFRSAAPVLELVDAVFAHPDAAGGVAEAGTIRHLADRVGHAGAVELWPPAPLPVEDAAPEPVVAARYRAQVSAPQRLADGLADWIAAQTDGTVADGTAEMGSEGRPLAPGDVLVLVQRRSGIAGALLKALKARGVPVGGLDRLVLTQQPAVQDLMALGDALLLPQDDLTFASMLTSPLGGLTDDSLMALATARRGALWEALRLRAPERPDWQAAWDFFAGLLRRVDHVTPHALLAEALGRLGGRARLFARLGPEAAEPVDEMLNAALTWQAQHPPSLQGFLHWLRQSGAEVKREQEAAGGAVRIMTAHAAKGLEARLVILPDTVRMPPPERGAVLWGEDPATGLSVPLWVPRAALHCAATRALRAAADARRVEEHNRLLYVALTRARDRLVVCGHEGKRALPEGSWYSLVRHGFEALEAAREPHGPWEGELRRHAVAQSASVAPAPVARPVPRVPLPAWAGAAPAWHAAPPPGEPARAQPLAPSRPDDAALGPVPAAASPLAERDPTGRRFLRGTLIHTLLQHLPEVPPAGRAAAARAWLERPGHGLTAAAAAAIAAETLAILAHPELAALFGPASRAEVPLTGEVAGQIVGGLVDRLAVLDGAVLVADFKTNRAPPADAAGTPVLYLRQMAAYRAVLRAIFPDRPVRCALVWTQAARVAMLDDALLDPHDPATRQAAGMGRLDRAPPATQVSATP